MTTKPTSTDPQMIEYLDHFVSRIADALNETMAEQTDRIIAAINRTQAENTSQIHQLHAEIQSVNRRVTGGY
jgi:gas vesicle protein